MTTPKTTRKKAPATALAAPTVFPGFALEWQQGQAIINAAAPRPSYIRDILMGAMTDVLEYDTVASLGGQYPLTMLTDCAAVVQSALTTQRDGAENKKIKAEWTALLDLVEEDRAARAKSFVKRQAEGRVELRDLPLLFLSGEELVIRGAHPIAGRLHSITIAYTFFGPRIDVALHVIHAMSGRPQEGIYRTSFPGFSDIRRIDELPFGRLDEATRAQLTERGQWFEKICTAGSYVRVKGSLLQQSSWSPREFNAHGRAVIDPESFRRIDPNNWQNAVHVTGIAVDDESANQTGGSLALDGQHWRCFSMVHGFSLTAKQWGRLNVSDLHAIEWRDTAFEKIVLDDEDKDLVRSLVQYHGSGFEDIISDKGGGLIFLLHGNPGEGKTLLAEAVAELQHKPLYAVSVGELGTSPEALEKRLRTVLDVATAWGAVVLLDEADIFLEQRDEQNIARNAMVGVFLRLLEYHNGVLFLTTNRVHNIDKAFYSRISVALHFPEGTGEKRRQIWHNLIREAGGDVTWATKLSRHAINGRQIKNALRTAHTLARAKDREICFEDIERSVALTSRFQTQMEQQKPSSR